MAGDRVPEKCPETENLDTCICDRAQGHEGQHICWCGFNWPGVA